MSRRSRGKNQGETETKVMAIVMESHELLQLLADLGKEYENAGLNVFLAGFATGVEFACELVDDGILPFKKDTV